MRSVDEHPAIASIARSLSLREPTLAERDEPYWESAVALVLRPATDDDLDLLFIRRAERHGDPWSGQIGLPGGRYSASDISLETTALRETEEELGLIVSGAGRVLGALDELRPRNPALPPMIVRPYVAAVIDPPELVPNVEVAEYRWIGLRSLFSPETRINTSVEVRGMRLRVDAYQSGDFTIWGLTEMIVSSFREAIGR